MSQGNGTFAVGMTSVVARMVHIAEEKALHLTELEQAIDGVSRYLENPKRVPADPDLQRLLLRVFRVRAEE